MKKVIFVPVKSSQIKEVGHVAETFTMYVKFHNNILYSYYPVTKKQFDEFKESESIGSHFHKNFKVNSKLKINNETKE